MDRQPVAIPERLTIEQALDEFFLRYGYPWFPVIDSSSRFIGVIDDATAHGVPPDERAEHDRRRDPRARRGLADDRRRAPLETVLGNQALRRLGALIAVDGEGRMSGVVTVDQVGRALQG